MTAFWWFAALALLLTVVAGLVFVTTRPGGADSVQAALLLGTTGVALALVLGQALALAHAVDVALVMAALAAVLGVAFALRGWPEDEPGDGDRT